MKKKTIIFTAIAVILVTFAVLFVPIPGAPYDDGGTREYTALTYKIVRWNRLVDIGEDVGEVYKKTRIYFGNERHKTIDELWALEEQRIEHSFIATVLELNGNTAMVQPMDGAWELKSSDKITFGISHMLEGINVGDIVKVTYTGYIMETYPAKINAVRWELATDLREISYPGKWLTTSTPDEYTGESSAHFVITAIYKDCFFANNVIPLPYKVKVNGTLGNEWCVGDQVLVSYTNVCYDNDNHRMECDLVSIEESDFRPDPNVAYKPVIYFYPENEIDITVRLTLDGRLTCTYPEYTDGWHVTAAQDGTLTDKRGQTYSYLYWEGETYADWDMSRGFCVKGEDTALFLEDALEKLGLNRREANEFIVYWLPLMQENPYNIISFQTDVYTNAAKLDIEPAPDTLIRVFMTYRASDSSVDMEAQELYSPVRNGFTVIEWGGSEVK